ADQSTSYTDLGHGQYVSARRVSLDAARLAGTPHNSTWHETLAKLHLRRGDRGERAGERKWQERKAQIEGEMV
ncbi:hypothetical protein GBF38_022437, partial [Nibea albiflora]